MKRQDRRLEMECLLSKYNKTDQTVRSFCEEHSMKESVFYYWQRQLDSVTNADLSEASVFTQLQIGDSLERIDVDLPSGLRIGLSGLKLAQLSILLLELDARHFHEHSNRLTDA